MSTTEDIAAILVDHLRSAPDHPGQIDVETDLLESGWLDSLRVMDLVCFLEARFQIQMLAADVNPTNLRSIKRLADYIQARQPGHVKAA